MAHSALPSGQLSKPLIRGWLQKRSRHMKQWRKRWVILQEFGIYTFKTNTNIISQATEIIDIHTVIYVKPCSDFEIKPSSDLPYCFEIYCINVTFIFNAESLESLTLWTKNIQQQLFKTYLNTNALSTNSNSDHNKISTLWICPNCAFKNSLSKRTCKFCGIAKTHKTTIISSAPHYSEEPVVNLADIVLNNIGSDEDIKEEPAKNNNKNTEQRWLCAICTFENMETLPFCEICGAQPITKKKLNIINLSAEQLDAEIQKSGDHKCRFTHLKCPCINRIISILIFYQKWLINVQDVEQQQAFDLAMYQKEIYGNNGPLLRLKAANKCMPVDGVANGNGFGVYDFINEILENYSNTLLLNDFNHILTYHCYKREIEAITTNIMRQFISNNVECGSMRCICLRRNHRDRDHTDMDQHRHRQELYFVTDVNDSNVNEVVTQQIVDRIHCRLIHSFQLYQFREIEYQQIRHTHSLTNNNALHLNHNRLKTIRDIMSAKKKNLVLLRGQNRIKNSKYTTQISSQYKYLENKRDGLDDDVSMKFGELCFYWKFYASKKWYVLKKYDNLKLELVNNKLYTLSVVEYNDLYTKCLFLSKCNQCKAISTKEKNISNFKYYDLNKNEVFSYDHIMAMLLYCNNDILCNIFIKTYDLNTDIQTFKTQHREYANWARLMREVGECFGDELSANNETFYHGISSQQLLFGETIRFNMPKSCTSKLSVGLQYASNGDYNGLILEVEKNKKMNDGIYYFSKPQCEIFSDFPAECESVFVGGYQSLKLKSILNIVQCENYKSYLSAIHHFQQLIIGHYPLQSTHSKSTVIAFNNLIKNEVRNEEEDMKSEKSIVPQYIGNLFHFIALKTNHKITLKINDICKHYHKSIKKLFISPNNNWCNLAVLVSLFPNVEKIWIENLQIDEVTMVKLYTFCESICENNDGNVQKIKYNPQVIKLNEIIIVDVRVKIDVNDTDYLSQIQKPFGQIIWNISLDLHDEYSKGIRLWR